MVVQAMVKIVITAYKYCLTPTYYWSVLISGFITTPLIIYTLKFFLVAFTNIDPNLVSALRLVIGVSSILGYQLAHVIVKFIMSKLEHKRHSRKLIKNSLNKK